MKAKATSPYRPAKTAPAVPPPPAAPMPGLRHKLRELFDELVFVFVIVMFIKLFLVEIYKIPTGSMTPTLLGGQVARVDANGDGLRDLVYWDLSDPSRTFVENTLVFLNNGKRLLLSPDYRLTPEQVQPWIDQDKIKNVYDRILVNKLPYWFHPPRRGEVVVFKVPDPPFRREAPIYIKRMIGEPGDELSFTIEGPADGRGRLLGRLMVNGQYVDDPPFFSEWKYDSVVNTGVNGFVDLPYVDYETIGSNHRLLRRVHVPERMGWVMGDNTSGSLDSRFWGGVPLEHFKGRAFLRVMPLSRIGWIH